MELNQSDSLRGAVRQFVLEQASEFGDQDKPRRFPLNPVWERLVDIGSELWLDSGDIDEIATLWASEMTALTTNNTLLNKEIQKGTYDQLVSQAGRMLQDFDMPESQWKLEIAFILNAIHGLRLVEQFHANVSVEEHTDLAHELDAAEWYAQRYHEISPQKFYVKLPLTPAGLLAARRLGRQGVAVNLTLGFSARHNYLTARVAQPTFVNVFLGRLNSFVADNSLGDGSYVGEKATLASQAAVTELRSRGLCSTRQIAASLRDGKQVADLVGLDVLTMPPKVARQFLDLALPTDQIHDRTQEHYRIGLAGGVDERIVGLDSLWDIPSTLVDCIDRADSGAIDRMSADDLAECMSDHGCADVLPRWRHTQVATSMSEGKIPRLSNWIGLLASRRIGLDSLMNLAGLCSFATDQQAMDDRVATVLDQAGVTHGI